MATTRENELRELLDGAARLLEENERMAGPGFRSHSLRQQIGEIQRELDRERWNQRSIPPVEQWGRSLGSISPELVREFQQTMNRIAPFTIAGRWAGEAPQAQELPRELRIMGCLVRADPACPDRHVYAVPQTHPIQVNRSYARSFAEDWRLGSTEAVIQSVQTPGQSISWPTESPDRMLADGVLSLISNLRREAGNANVNPELFCSPRTYARLRFAWTLLETGQSPAPPFLLGKESQTFEDEMDAALQAFQQDRKSA